MPIGFGRRKWVDGVEVDPDSDPLRPWEYERLARYNGEASRGIVHTDEWKAEMADLQRRFDDSKRPFTPRERSQDPTTGP